MGTAIDRRLMAVMLALACAMVLCFAGPRAAFAATGLAAVNAVQTQEKADAQLRTQAVKYDIWIGGKRVTSANAKDVFDDKTVSYNAKTNTITLKNATIKKARVFSPSATSAKIRYWWNYGIRSDQASGSTLKIKLVGKNRIAMPSKKSPVMNYGIATNGALVIYGSGSLKVTSNKALCYQSGILARTLTLQGSVKVTVGTKGKKSSKAEFRKQKVNVSPNYGRYGMVVEEVLTVKGRAQLIAKGPEGAIYKEKKPNVVFASGYNPLVKAGPSASKLKVNKVNPAKSVYTKYKYLKITNSGKSSTSNAPGKTKISAASRNVGEIEVSWTKTKSATGLDVALSTSSDFKSGYQYNSWKTGFAGKSSGSFSISNLKSGTTYYLRLRAFNVINSKKYYGSWSTVSSITPL